MMEQRPPFDSRHTEIGCCESLGIGGSRGRDARNYGFGQVTPCSASPSESLSISIMLHRRYENEATTRDIDSIISDPVLGSRKVPRTVHDAGYGGET